MSSSVKDVLIIGQGIAGTCLSYFLEKLGKSFDIIDRKIPVSSSRAAAGIMNPVTGKFFSLSWEYPILYPLAIETYSGIANLLGIESNFSTPIYRILKNASQENEWLYRAGQEMYAPFMSDKLSGTEKQNLEFQGTAIGELKHGFQVPVPLIIEKWRERLISQNSFIEEEFDFDQLVLASESVQYKSNTYQRIVFCDGAQMMNNPFFNYLPMQPAKGEAILIYAPELKMDSILKEEVFIAPWHVVDHYWIGATYAWNTLDNQTTKEKQSYLEAELNRMIKVPFSIISRLAGIRPAVKDRKPLVGIHPNYPNLCLLNGLGTKGTSLGPFAADALCKLLYFNTELPTVIDIRRFQLK
jgi:glycine oxidase